MSSSISQSRKVFALLCVLRLVLVVGLIALSPDFGWPQGGKGSLRIEEQIHPWGVTLGVRFTAPAPEKDYYGVEPWPDNFDANTAPDDQSGRGAYRKVIPRGVWRFDTHYLGSFALDPARAVLNFTMVGQQGLNVGTVGLAKALLWRPISPARRALDLGGRERFAPGEPVPVTVKLQKPSAKQPVASDGRTGPQDATCCLSLAIYRPGRVTAGGATEADRLVADRFLGTLDEGKAEVTVAPDPALHPGTYELRLVAPGKVVLDRVRFDVVLPKAALQVISGGNPSDPGETVIRVDAPQWKFLRMLKVERGGELQFVGAAFTPLSASGDEIRLSSTAPLGQPKPPLPPRPPGMDDATWRKLAEAIGKAVNVKRSWQVPGLADSPPGTLAPGEYEARLYWNELGEAAVQEPEKSPVGTLEERQREYIIASVRFTIPAEEPEKKAEAPKAPVAVTLELKTPRVVIESPIEATVKLPPELSPANEALWLSFFRKSGTTGEGLRYEDAYIRAPIPLGKDSRVVFPAPHLPGRYELRLYRGDQPPRFALRFPPADLLARADVEVVVPPLRGALRLAGRSVIQVGESTELFVQIPRKRFRRGFEVVLVNSAEVLPGGAVRLPDATRFYEVTACRVRIPVEPFKSFGVFEFRLFDRDSKNVYGDASFGVARLPFKVVDPDLPPFPPEIAHRLADEPEWLASSVTVGGAPGEADETDPECVPPDRAQSRIAPGGRWPQDGP